MIPFQLDMFVDIFFFKMMYLVLFVTCVFFVLPFEYAFSIIDVVNI